MLGQHTILGSGDLFTARDCLDMIAQTGVDGVTVARGAIGNPWIFQQARALAGGQPLPAPPTVRQQGEVIGEHYRLAEEIYGPRSGPLMRKLGIKYSALHPDSSQVRAAFVAVRHRADWQQVLDEWYQDDRPGQYPDPAMHRPGVLKTWQPARGAWVLSTRLVSLLQDGLAACRHVPGLETPRAPFRPGGTPDNSPRFIAG